MKYFIFSFDDGTVFDRRTVEILDKYHLSATFNLNSGLDDYVWYNEGREVRRFKLNEVVDLYQNHEIASHSLTHPHFTDLDNDTIYYQVKEDIVRLENTFKKEVTSFAFPFEDYDERCIDIIKNYTKINAIRLSEIDRSFKFPADQYHIKITSLDIREALGLVDDFFADDTAELFTFVCHGYDFAFDKLYFALEELCKKLVRQNDVKVITTKELVGILNK